MIKQYVNLPIDYDENHGNRVKLEVEASNLTEDDVQRTEWWVEPVGNDNQDEKYLSRFQRARLRWPNTRNRHDKFQNYLNLPHVGGDNYVVKCSKRGDRSSPVEQEEVETWRKLYYTVHYMNNACRDFFNDLKDRFEAVYLESYIEFEKVASNATLVDEPHTRSTNTLPHLYRRRPRLTNRPFHLRLVVLNNIYDAEAKEFNGDVTMRVVVFTSPEGLDPDRPIRSVHARRVDRRTWINVTRNSSKTADDQITIRLEDNTRIKRALDDGHEIRLRIRFRQRGEYCGHSIGNFCVVRIQEEGTPAAQRTTVLQTITHEIGHGCQQVVRRERTYSAAGSATGWEMNPIWHTDNFGGQGPHCSTNAVLAASTDTTSGQVYVHGAGTLCTMFFRADDAVDADGKFCTECKPRLTRVNIGARQMRLRGWGRY